MQDSSLNKRRRPLSLSRTPFENTPIEFTQPLSNSKSSQLYPTKPTYVAREIHLEKLPEHKDDKLFDPSVKLLQIPEESLRASISLAGEESKRSESMDFDSLKFDASPLKNSIFNSELPANSKLQEQIKGPQFRNGKLLRYSVVGPHEIFEKLQRKKHHLGTSTKYSEVSSTTNTESLTNFLRNSVRTNSIILDSAAPNNKKLLEAKSKKVQKDIKIPKEQVLAEIENIKAKETQFYRLIDGMANRMGTSDMLHFTKEKRCLDQFRKTEERWTKAFEKTGSHIGRSPNQSVLFRAEEFREKKEKVEEIEGLKNDLERLGANFWHLTLRKAAQNKGGSFPFVKDEIPIAFNTSVIYRPRTSVEIIRKPKSLNVSLSNGTLTNPESTSYNTPTRLSNKTAAEYLEERLTHHWEMPNQYKPSPEEMQDFMVKKKNGINFTIYSN